MDGGAARAAEAGRANATAGARQLALPFAHRPRFERADFLPMPGNEAALRWLDRGAWRGWPGRRLALSGEAGSGKTHLLHVWAAEQDALLLPGTALRGNEPVFALLSAHPAIALDDADTAPDRRALLHLLNGAQERGLPLLLTAREPPARWIAARTGPDLPDLSSRLRAIHAVPIAAPDAAMLRLLMARLLVERQLSVPGTVLDWLLPRLPREPAALRDVARRLDEAALAERRPITRALASAVLPDLCWPAEPGTPPAPDGTLLPFAPPGFRADQSASDRSIASSRNQHNLR